MKFDPGIYIVMHSVLSLKTGVTVSLLLRPYSSNPGRCASPPRRLCLRAAGHRHDTARRRWAPRQRKPSPGGDIICFIF